MPLNCHSNGCISVDDEADGYDDINMDKDIRLALKDRLELISQNNISFCERKESQRLKAVLIEHKNSGLMAIDYEACDGIKYLDDLVEQSKVHPEL